MTAWWIGLAGSAAIAAAAWKKGSLSTSGAAGAIVVGTLMYALGSAAWFGTLIAFFVTSSALTKWKAARKANAEASYEKSGRRDAGQVAANGGAAALLCCLNAAVTSAEAHALAAAAFVGAMAAVTADTWATEIGAFSRKVPISIRTGKRVEPGVSGGVTGLGFAASAGGGLTIGVVFWALQAIGGAAPAGGERLGLLMSTACGLFGGIFGSGVDSYIGAVWQRMRRCAVCGREVEAAFHCGQVTSPSRGLNWMNNDAVNVIASLAGAAAAVLIRLAAQ